MFADLASDLKSGDEVAAAQRRRHLTQPNQKFGQRRIEAVLSQTNQAQLQSTNPPIHQSRR